MPAASPAPADDHVVDRCRSSIAVIQAAVTGTSDIGCITYPRKMGLDATSAAATRPARELDRRRPSRNVAITISAPESGADPEPRAETANLRGSGHQQREPGWIARHDALAIRRHAISQRRKGMRRVGPRQRVRPRLRRDQLAAQPEVGLADVAVRIGAAANHRAEPEAEEHGDDGDRGDEDAVIEQDAKTSHRVRLAGRAGRAGREDPRGERQSEKEQRAAGLMGADADTENANLSAPRHQQIGGQCGGRNGHGQSDDPDHAATDVAIRRTQSLISTSSRALGGRQHQPPATTAHSGLPDRCTRAARPRKTGSAGRTPRSRCGPHARPPRPSRAACAPACRRRTRRSRALRAPYRL